MTESLNFQQIMIQLIAHDNIISPLIGPHFYMWSIEISSSAGHWIINPMQQWELNEKERDLPSYSKHHYCVPLSLLNLHNSDLIKEKFEILSSNSKIMFKLDVCFHYFSKLLLIQSSLVYNFKLFSRARAVLWIWVELKACKCNVGK